MHKFYKIILTITTFLAIILGSYVYYIVTYNVGFINVTNFVNDHTQKLETDFINSISNICQNLFQKTKISLIIVMLQSTKPYDSSFYTSQLLKNYLSANRDVNGAIIMLINLDKGTVNMEIAPEIQFLFSPSYGEKILNENVIPMLNEADKVAQELISNNKSPEGANEYFGRAILEGVRAISQKVMDEYAKQKFIDEMIKQKKQIDNIKPKFYFSWWFYLGLCIIIILIYITFKTYKLMRCPKCFYKLKITEEIIEVPEKEKPGLTIEVYTCNHCGYYTMQRVVTYESKFYLHHLIEVLKDIIKTYYRKKKREYRKKLSSDD